MDPTLTYLLIGLMVLIAAFIIVLFVKVLDLSKRMDKGTDDSKTLEALSIIGEAISKNQRDQADSIDRQMKASNDAMNMQMKQNSEALDRQLKVSNENVSQRIQEVYKQLADLQNKLGEMQSLASGVNDLKKVLSNVKTRGILGEVQLEAILEEILNPDQYETNIETVPGTGKRVEFAVKFPGEGDRPVYLPIDSKFPGETYGALVDAYEEGDKVLVDACWKTLEQTIKNEAKDIRDKYIEVPYTTDFAIMFLPFEGLYAEVVRRGLVEILQRDYKINIAGPTTMAALLNSFQMGFRTLAIEKNSSEVWKTLGAVKTEFGKFNKTLDDAHKHINLVEKDIDELVGVRSRAMERKLREVEALPEQETLTKLGFDSYLDEYAEGNEQID